MLHETMMSTVDIEQLQPISRTYQYRKVCFWFFFLKFTSIKPVDKYFRNFIAVLQLYKLL